MKPMTMEEIRRAAEGRLLSGNPEAEVCSVSTDSRSAEPGSLFIPLTGEKNNAHRFLRQAAERGCAGALIAEDGPFGETPEEKITLEDLKKYKNLTIIKVCDTTKALQNLARFYLASFGMKKIGVTGSTGKTTTKEMIYSICSRRFFTGKNKGNFNNHIGLPMTILSFEEGTEAGVLEMGTSEPGEIRLLADLARPDIGVITNIGTSHIETLGSREGILRAKMEIADFFGKENTLVVNGDDDLLGTLASPRQTVKRPYRVVTAGEKAENDVVISGIEDKGEDGIAFSLEFKGESFGNGTAGSRMQRFRLPVPGRHNAFNAALAAAACFLLGIEPEEAAEGLAGMERTGGRLSIREKNGIKIIDDTYNASPDSMKAAVEVLCSVAGRRKVAILADMLEMGPRSELFHREVGDWVGSRNVDLLITVGPAARWIGRAARKKNPDLTEIHYERKEDLLKTVREEIKTGDVVLLKGSRGMEMDQVAAYLSED